MTPADLVATIRESVAAVLRQNVSSRETYDTPGCFEVRDSNIGWLADEIAHNAAQAIVLADETRVIVEHYTGHPTPVISTAPTAAAITAKMRGRVVRASFVPRIVSTVRNLPCDRCGSTIDRDGVSVQVAEMPERMFRHYHRRCQP